MRAVIVQLHLLISTTELLSDSVRIHHSLDKMRVELANMLRSKTRRFTEGEFQGKYYSHWKMSRRKGMQRIMAAARVDGRVIVFKHVTFNLH